MLPPVTMVWAATEGCVWVSGPDVLLHPGSELLTLKIKWVFMVFAAI